MSELNFIDQIPEDDGFHIQDDPTAEWALSKIREADDQLRKMEDWYKTQLEGVRKSHESTVSYFTMKLAEYLRKVPAKETRTTTKYSLPSGELVLTKAKTEIKAVDNEALLGWCQENAPELVRVKMEPAWADIKKRLAEVEGGIADLDTGTFVEGVQLVEVPESFRVKTKEETK